MEQRDDVAIRPNFLFYLKQSFLSTVLFVLLYAAVFALAWFSQFVWGVGLTPASFVVLFAILLVAILVLLGIADPRRLAKSVRTEPEPNP